MAIQQLPFIPFHIYNVNESFDENHEQEQKLLLHRLNQLKKRQLAQQKELFNLQKEQLEFEDIENIYEDYEKETNSNLLINTEDELNDSIPLQSISESISNSISNSLIYELTSIREDRSIKPISELTESDIKCHRTEAMQTKETKIIPDISNNEDKPIVSKFNKIQNFDIFLEKELATNIVKNNPSNNSKIQKKPFLKKGQGLTKYLPTSSKNTLVTKTDNKNFANTVSNNKNNTLHFKKDSESVVQPIKIFEIMNANKSSLKFNEFHCKSDYEDKDLEEFELLENALDNTSFSSNFSSISKIIKHHKIKNEDNNYVDKTVSNENNNTEFNKYIFNDEETWDSNSNINELGIIINDNLSIKNSISSKQSTDSLNDRTPPVSKLISKFFPNIETNNKQININTLNSEVKIDRNINIVESNDTKNINDNKHVLILKERVKELESEIKIYKGEITALLEIKKNFLVQVDEFKNEKLLFEKKKHEDFEKFEQYKTEQYKKLNKEKKIFDTFHKNVKNQLSIKEREEINSLKNEILKLKELFSNKEQKLISSNKRLKDKVKQLEEDNEQLKKDFLEETRLCKLKNQENNKFIKSDSKVNLNFSEPCIQVLKNGPNSPNYNLIDNKKLDFSNPLPIFNHIDNTEEYKEIIHSDGKIEHINVDGSKEIYYANGTKKEISSDGISTNITFFNGDIKRIYADQRIMYYYAEAKTRHTTYSNGLEVFEFPNDQVEKHFPNGKKEIIFPDRTIKYIYPDGNEESVLENGTVIRILLNGEKVMEYPNGQKEIHNNDFKRREYPDGTVKTIYPDGRQETHYPTGRLRIKDKDGVLIVDTCI